MSFDIVDLSAASSHEQILKQKALDISGNMKTTRKFAWKAIAKAQESLSKPVDKHQKNMTYTVREKIWLSTRNITTDGQFKKLDYKMLSFFAIIRNKRASDELQLPQSIEIHNIFHSNLLFKASIDLLTYQVNKPLPLIIINNEEKGEVEDILDAKSPLHQLSYRVKWVSLDKDRE